MKTLTNRQVRLRSRPSAIPQAEHFEITQEPVPALAQGQVLVRNVFLSVEPAMRGWLSAVGNYSEPVPDFSDQELFSKDIQTPIHVVPNGMDGAYFTPATDVEVEPASLVFTGMMAYVPNHDGITWFLDEVLPLIAAKVPKVSTVTACRCATWRTRW